MIIWYTACCEVLSTKLSVSIGFHWAVTYLYNFILFLFLYCMKDVFIFHSVYWLLIFPDHIPKSHQLVCLHTGLRKYGICTFISQQLTYHSWSSEIRSAQTKGNTCKTFTSIRHHNFMCYFMQVLYPPQWISGILNKWMNEWMNEVRS